MSLHPGYTPSQENSTRNIGENRIKYHCLSRLVTTTLLSAALQKHTLITTLDVPTTSHSLPLITVTSHNQTAATVVTTHWDSPTRYSEVGNEAVDASASGEENKQGVDNG